MRAKKIIRRLVWTLLALATFIALFYAEEDWRGARAWQAVLRQMRDAGEPMTLRELIPPGPPQADLSRTVPFADENPGLRSIRIPSGTGDTPRLASVVPLREIDLAAWQHYFRLNPENHFSAKPGAAAANVLLALSPLDSFFAQLEKALAIPGGYLPVDYDMGFGTRLSSSVMELNVAKVLQLRGLAHLENGQSQEARDDFLLRFRMEQPLRHRLFLIDLLVLAGNQAMTLPILWQGLHQHAWSDADLQQMENALMSHNFLSDYQRALRGERLGAFQVIAVLTSKDGAAKNQDSNPGVRLFARAFQIWPKGWIDQDRAAIGQREARVIASLHPETGLFDRESLLPPETSWVASHIDIFSSELSPVIFTTSANVAQAETYRRLACVACELERYYLAHHAYPKQLSELTGLPPHLDQEVLSLAPLHYQNLGSTYRLYSVGWDEKDDGGRFHAEDPKQGDWPWPGP